MMSRVHTLCESLIVFLVCTCTMAAQFYQCGMCAFGTEDQTHYNNHVIRIHRNDPQFKVYCDVGNCGFSSKSWGSYKVHVSKLHKEVAIANNDDELGDNDVGGMDIDEQDLGPEPEMEVDIPEQKKVLFASYMLNLETNMRLTERALNVVAENTQYLIEHHLRLQRREISQLLQDRNIDTQILDDVETENNTGISGFLTKEARDAFYKSHCRMIEPMEIVLGHRNVEKNGLVKHVCDKGQIIPLHSLLQLLVSMPEILHCVENPHVREDDYMFDWCDGRFMENHPLFGVDKNALQLVLYTDDLEIVNPLGPSIKKHKITVFYVMLLNIPPEDRSRLSSIFLLAIAKSNDLKRHGFKRLLADFISTVNKLSSTGLDFDINGERRNMKGGLIAVIADTPAANLLGGFKEGVGFAHKPCRTCHVSHDELPNKLTHSQCDIRTLNDHVQKCNLLFDQPLTRQAQKEWSKQWGLNGKSILLEINNFDVCKCLVQDPMHVLLEGALPNEVARFIYYSIELKGFFTLGWLNNELATFPYTYLEISDKPEPILKTHYFDAFKIKCKSASMLTLCTVLPFILCKKVPHDDPKYKNLLLLFQITHLSTSPCITASTCADLKYLISEHHRGFIEEYPRASFIPKLHYIVHFTEQFLDFGPGRVQWCMRFEGKHGQFTGVKWKNFKNLPKSMAKKHQRWMCFQMLSPTGLPSENCVYSGDDVCSGKEITVEQLPPRHHGVLVQRFPGIATIYKAETVVIHGNIYKPGCILILDYDSDNFPVFGWLGAIYVHEHMKLFMCNKVNITDVVEVVNAFEIVITDDLVLVSYTDLLVKMPLSIHFFDNRPCVCNKYGHMSHTL